MRDLRNTFAGKKILITGDTGFKGSWLCIWLKELGAEVYGYALPPKTTHDNFVVCSLAKEIEHTDGDIRDADKLKKTFQRIKPDLAFHLAAQALVLESYTNPAETFETNVMGTVNFFEAVRQTPSIRAALNVTSDKCYQNVEQAAGYREDDAMGGNDPYSASKGCSELVTNAYIKSFFQTGECLIASARAGNVIGGGDWAENRIIPDVFRAYFSGRDLVLRNPKSTRPWQFVLEPIFGYLSLAEGLLQRGKELTGGWNFGPKMDNDFSVEDVIREIKKSIPDLKTTIDASENKPHEAKLLRLDISKALKHLEWKPLLTFQETLQFTVDGYTSEKKSSNVYEQRVEQINRYISKY